MPETTENNGSIIKFPTAAERIKAEIAEILGPDNKWFAGERVKREPTNKDCYDQWVEHGGREHFNTTHALAA
jgi:hypothetical protein